MYMYSIKQYYKVKGKQEKIKRKWTLNECGFALPRTQKRKH